MQLGTRSLRSPNKVIFWSIIHKCSKHCVSQGRFALHSEHFALYRYKYNIVWWLVTSSFDFLFDAIQLGTSSRRSPDEVIFFPCTTKSATGHIRSVHANQLLTLLVWSGFVAARFLRTLQGPTIVLCVSTRLHKLFCSLRGMDSPVHQG